jgi:hypothetical protein
MITEITRLRRTTARSGDGVPAVRQRNVGTPGHRIVEYETDPSIARSVPALDTWPTGGHIGAEQDAEHEGVRHQEKRHEHGGNEVRGTLLAGCDSYAQTIALIKCVEQIDGADDVEHPHEDGPQPSPKRCDREQREQRRRKISIGSGTRESSRQFRRDHPGTRNAKPTNRKACRKSSGRSASARGLPRSAGQMYRAAISPQTTTPRSTLIPKITCGCLVGSVQMNLLDETPTCHRAAATTKSREGRTREARGMSARAPEGSA